MTATRSGANLPPLLCTSEGQQIERLDLLDREQLAEVVWSLQQREAEQLLVTVCTRPAPAKAHPVATLTPIGTWRALFEAAGFEVFELASDESATDASFDFLTAHWSRVDPFRDGAPALRLLRLTPGAAPDEPSFRTAAARLLDTSYRAAKRTDVAGPASIVYAVNFVQDWAFLRSLMDVWPADRLKVLFRRDCLEPHFLARMEARCRIAGVEYATESRGDLLSMALARWALPPGSAFLTATEGVRSPLHKVASLLALEASRSLRTVCLQHGAMMGRTMRPASQTFAAWDEESAEAIAAVAAEDDLDICVTGSLKFQDALLPAEANGLEARFGSWVAGFRRRVLVGLNLHWDVHAAGPEATAEWLARLADANPDVLFLLRPHPDDPSVHDRTDLLARPNVLLIDELVLFALDAAVARLVGEVDGVITTASTLVLDAVAAGRPVVVLPTRDTYGDPAHFLPMARGYLERSPPVLTREEWATGALPAGLDRPSQPGPAFAPSRRAAERLVALLASPPPAPAFPLHTRYGNIAEAFLALDFDKHPHSGLARVADALGRFALGYKASRRRDRSPAETPADSGSV